MRLLGIRARAEGGPLAAGAAPLHPAVVRGEQATHLVGGALGAGRRAARVPPAGNELGGRDALGQSGPGGAAVLRGGGGRRRPPAVVGGGAPGIVGAGPVPLRRRVGGLRGLLRYPGGQRWYGRLRRRTYRRWRRYGWRSGRLRYLRVEPHRLHRP